MKNFEAFETLETKSHELNQPEAVSKYQLAKFRTLLKGADETEYGASWKHAIWAVVVLVLACSFIGAMLFYYRSSNAKEWFFEQGSNMVTTSAGGIFARIYVFLLFLIVLLFAYLASLAIHFIISTLPQGQKYTLVFSVIVAVFILAVFFFLFCPTLEIVTTPWPQDPPCDAPDGQVCPEHGFWGGESTQKEIQSQLKVYELIFSFIGVLLGILMGNIARKSKEKIQSKVDDFNEKSDW